MPLSKSAADSAAVTGAKARLGTCSTCREPIMLGATKCIHCGTPQNWQRYLSMSSTVLALLVALVGVLGAVIPVLVSLYEHNRSEVALGLIRVSGNEIALSVSNAGGRPGIVIAAGGLHVSNGPDDFNAPLEFAADLGAIAPGASTVLTAHLPQEATSQLADAYMTWLGRSGPWERVAGQLRPKGMSAVAEFQVAQFGKQPVVLPFPVRFACIGRCVLWEARSPPPSAAWFATAEPADPRPASPANQAPAGAAPDGRKTGTP
jgi:hypothetical protein